VPHGGGVGTWLTWWCSSEGAGAGLKPSWQGLPWSCGWTRKDPLPQTLKPKAFRVDRCLRCWCQSEAHSEGNLSLPEEKHRSWVREPQTLHSHASLTVPLGREL
jgi:hypothetical protein